MVEGQFVILVFADEIDLMWSSENELQDFTTRLEEKARAYGMEVSSEKSKVLVNSINQNTPIDITMDGQNLEEVDSFKYIGSTLSKDGTSTKEIKIRIAVAMLYYDFTSMGRADTSASQPSLSSTEHSLYPTSSTDARAGLWQQSQRYTYKHLKRDASGDSSAFRRLNIKQTNIWDKWIPLQEPLLTTVKRRHHITRHNTIANNILQGTLEGRRRRGRQRKTG